MSTLQAAFTLKLTHKILPKTVSVGKLDAVHPSLIAATTNGKVFVHTPNSSLNPTGRLRRSEVADVSLLNINQSVRALSVGTLIPGSSKEVVVVGTPTHALAYDVDNNTDLFYREVPDGVNCIVTGLMSGVQLPLAICGGNCAIQGFDFQGNDLFWTVTGDNVSALCLCDFDGDGQMELVVGSEDFDIRVFKQDDIIAEMTETEAITSLCPLGENKFAYCLANGTLGVYEGINRVWRIKSKNHVMGIHLFDIDGDGMKEMAVGWSSGKLDFRSSQSGEVLLKEQFNTTIAGIVDADYRMDGHVELICCSTDGEVRGYLPPNQGGAIVHTDPTQEILHELGMRKQNLLLELKNYEENRRITQDVGGDNFDVDKEQLGVIPTSLYVNAGNGKEQPCVELYVSTSNDTLVRAVMIFAEGVFPGESHTVHPNLSQVSSSCRVQLRPEKDLAVDLHVKALVGYKQSLQYHVFELSRTLPRFSMYALCNENAPQPSSYTLVKVTDRPQRVALWVNENFLLQEEISVGKDGTLDARFFSLRGAGMLFIQMPQNGELYIRCDDMELCGDVVQAVADYLGIQDLKGTAEFPNEIDRLMNLIEKVNSVYMVRDQMSADVADHSSLIKALLIRAEDARLMRDMSNMKRYCTQLYNVNQELLSQYRIRCNNHEELLNCLKQINQIIQRAGRLRVGKSKTEVVNSCRQAIKNGNTAALPKIVKMGAS